MSDTYQKNIRIRINIDVPPDIGENALQNLTQIASQLQQLGAAQSAQPFPTKVSSSVADTERQARIEQCYEDRKKEFRLKAIQAYRLFRRIRGDFEKEYDVYKTLAKRFEWPVGVVQSQVCARRSQIKKHLKKRMQTTILRLALKGKTHKQIAKHVGLHDKTVAVYYREAKRARGL